MLELTLKIQRTLSNTELKTKLKGASPLALYEVDEVIESIAINSPTANKESISIAVEAIVNLESSKNGQELLASSLNLMMMILLD